MTGTALPATLDGWLDYITAQHPSTIAMGLDRVRAVWQHMAPACPRAPVNIIVGGTNGKGSTCAMLERILHCAGYKVGCYTSPHLLHYRERVRIGLTELPDSAHCEAFAAVENARREAGVALTYFEFGTLAALRIFASHGVEVAVLEVGLGGRLDAVNIVDADCAILVSVDLDHMEYLGPDREAIGFEKAHIFRPGQPAIYGETDPPDTVVKHAAGIGARLLVRGRDFGFEHQTQQWQFHGPRGKRHALPIPALRGPYQLANASGVLAALAELQDQLPVTQGDVRRGLLEVELPGRLQVLPGRPVIVMDVAHNPHAARVLEDALGTMGFFERTLAVFAMLKDKDAAQVVDIVRHRIDHWHVAGLGGDRGMSGAALAEVVARAGVASAAISAHVNVAGALHAARAGATPNDRILVFGSFHTVAEAMAALDVKRPTA
ncbi:MAG: bifunctional tetrahydrofolate synthase/dihydrofolate synthase [Burkholderiales bacterium]|nr:bifunctional tetrahydrofolate synthase/dihydrofolate synthase [Burkholderiales bacterium]